MTLSLTVIKQSKGTTYMMQKAKQLLDYLAMYPDATICFLASNMIMNVHSDASYSSKSDAQRWRTFLYRVVPQRWRPYQVEWRIFTLCKILCFVIAFAAEAKLGTLFLNCKEGMIFCLTHEELGHPQPKTPIHCKNATAVGIANNTINRQ